MSAAERMKSWPLCDICGKRSITLIGLQAHRSGHGMFRRLSHWLKGLIR